MKAMVLCAGYGTRLGSLTSDTPKALLKLDQHPIIAYILTNLARSGITEIVINLHFKPEMIQNYVGDGKKFGVHVTYSYEPVLLGTAGGVKNVESFFKDCDAFLVHYGDILTNQNIHLMMDAHQNNNALATLLLHQRNRSNSVVVLDDNNRIMSFLERPTDEERRGVHSQWVNSGIFICDPKILEEVPPNVPCDFPKDIFSPMVATKRLFGFPLSGYRCAIDSQDRLEQARIAIADGRVNLKPSE